ncbi:MAG: SulP family inorganic anion transporter [Bacillota bacterium]
MLTRWIPALGWLRNYKREDLSGDLSAGLTVAVMLVPQGMAYALLAGLPPVIGLYAVTIPLIVYALLGTSRQLAVGPVAMMSLLTLAGVSRLAEPMSEQYIAYVLLLSLMVGVIQLLLGLLRLGFIVNFLSHAVISGFTSAAAIIIGLSQLGHLLGVGIRAETFLEIVHQAAEKVGQTNPVTLVIGLGAIGLLVLFKKRWPKFPAPLVVVGLGTVLVATVGLDQTGVKIVGEVPQGLPSFSLPAITWESIQVLLPTALTASFVGFMESIAVAKSIAAKEKYRVDPDQELKALGLANIVGSFFSSSPVTGGFSRTAVNYQAGARTGLASIISALMIVAVLLFLTPLFYYLPNAILAAIVMVAVYGLIDLREPRHLWKVQRSDALTLGVTFAATLLLGIENGILLGAAFSLLLFIWRSAHPHMAELGWLEQEQVFRNTRRYPHAETFKEALILRIDGPLYFANLGFVEERLRKAVTDRPDLRWVVLDMSGVGDMDAVAVDALDTLVADLRARGLSVVFTGMKGPVRDLVRRAGWAETYGRAIDHLSVEHALEALGLLKRGLRHETA